MAPTPGGVAISNKPMSCLEFGYKPRSKAQRDVDQVWPNARILFHIGPAGTGKSVCALGNAIRDALVIQAREKLARKVEDGDRAREDKPKLWLTRPTVACEEDLGFFPGTHDDKMSPWLNHFQDCFEAFTNSSWESVKKFIKVETPSLGMIRGRTIRGGVFICDEMQNASPSQIKLLLTRLGERSKIVICGDPGQSDRYSPLECPMVRAANKLHGLAGVHTIHFDQQLRDPLVGEILERLK